MGEVARVSYSIDDGLAVHRVAWGGRLFTLLGSMTSGFTFLEAADQESLGVSFCARNDSLGRMVIEAIRPGIAAGDDELIAKVISSVADGIQWIVSPVPTPRGQVISSLCTSLIDLPPSLVSPVDENEDGALDDTSLVEEALGCDGEEANMRRLRFWRFEESLVVAAAPVEGATFLLLQVIDGQGLLAGEVRVSADHHSPPTYYRSRFDPFSSGEQPDEELQSLLSKVRGLLWEGAE